MGNTPQSTRLERFQQRLLQSRYWSVSLAIHTVVIASLGTLVLVQSSPDDDFQMAGVPVTHEIPVPIPVDPDERPAIVEPLQTSQPSNKFDPVSTAQNTTPPPVHIPIELSSLQLFKEQKVIVCEFPPFTPPHDFKTRFTKDGRNHVVMTVRPGTPKPTDATENAVLGGLKWLRENQEDDGSWGKKHKGAMTGLALLCFLGHGETTDSREFGLAVNRAINWVLAEGTKHQGRLSMTAEDWGPGNGGVYEHGILTYALGEYYTITRDERVTELLRQAVGHIVRGQGPDGGWMYRYDKTQGDTSVTGWQVQALKAAYLTKLGMAGLEQSLNLAMEHFDRVQGPKGGYGYRTPGDRYSLTGVGLLAELFWKERRDSKLSDGVEFVLKASETEFPINYQHETADLYAWYYHTQAMLMFGGSAWTKWEAKVRPAIVKSQVPDGSWPVMKAAGHGNLQNEDSVTGAIYRTALSVLVLESYYRYLPLNQASQPMDTPRLALK
jgi:hypothetical protein